MGKLWSVFCDLKVSSVFYHDHCIVLLLCYNRDHFVYVPSQWKMVLQCNIISHWLGPCSEWSMLLWNHRRHSLISCSQKSFGVFIWNILIKTDCVAMKCNCRVYRGYPRALHIQNLSLTRFPKFCKMMYYLEENFTKISKIPIQLVVEYVKLVSSSMIPH